MPGLLEGKTGFVFGVANKRSIAWAIAQALHGAGMRLAYTYQGDRLKENVEGLVKDQPGAVIVPCDVTKEAEIDAAFSSAGEKFGGLDCLVHSIAFANREDLEGEFLKTTWEGFKTALEVSAYSLTALARRAAPLMEKKGGGSIVTMTYLGGERVVPSYNVMGIAKAALESSVRYLARDLGPRNIRVNALSAGPIRTLAASGVSGFSQMLDQVAARAPLKRNVEAAEVGDAALFLASPLSRGVTGEVIYVDAGYHITGM